MDAILPGRNGIIIPLNIGIQEVQPWQVERDDVNVPLDNMNNDNLEEQQLVSNETLLEQTVEGGQIWRITQPNLNEINPEELRRSTQVRKSTIMDDYVVYLEEVDIGVGNLY